MKIFWIVFVALWAGNLLASSQKSSQERDQTNLSERCQELTQAKINPDLTRNPELQKAIVNCLAPLEDERRSVAQK